MDYIELEKKAKEIYLNEPSGHDYSHIQRVLDYCIKMQASEGGDFDVIFVSALFHDVHRVISSKVGHFVSAEDAMSEVENILSTLDIDEDILNDILYVIREHDNKTNDVDMPIELQIVQDADILDALGEVGLMRTLQYCKTHNIPLTNSNFSLDASEYIADINPISTVHYVYRTMIPQYSLLHTNTAKILATDKVKHLQDFVNKHKG